MRFQKYRDAMRLKDTLQTVRDLPSKSLLHRKALGEQPHQACELGNTDDVFMRDVADIGLPIEGQRVVLAQRIELDRPFDYLAETTVRPATTLGVKDRQQLRVAIIPSGGIVQGA